MKTKFMFISCTLALIMSAAVLWAQEKKLDVPVEVKSPQKDATATLKSSEADQFMSVTDWGSVSFNKAFVYLGYTHGDQTVDVGAAFKAGPVYIGSFYRGDFGEYKADKNKQSVETDPALEQSGSGAGTFSNVKKTTKTSFGNSYEAWHTAAMLIGYGNMGFQVGYMHKGKNESGKFYAGNFNNEDKIEHHTKTGSITVDEAYDSKGFRNKAKHVPFVAFGMNIPVGAMTISPTASLKVLVDQGGKSGEVDQVSQYGVKTMKKSISDTQYSTEKDANGSKNNMYTAITGKVGTDIALGDSLNSVVTVGYEFTVRAFGKTYKDLSGEKHKVKGVYDITKDSVMDLYNTNSIDGSVSSVGKHTITKEFEATKTEKTYFSNTLTPGYSLQKDFTDRLSLFAGVECPIEVSIDNAVATSEYKKVEEVEYINPSAVHNNSITTTVRTITPKRTTKITTVKVEPAAMAAISYAAIPNRLSFNLGTKIDFLKGKHTYTQVSQDGVIQKDETTTVYPNQRDYEVRSDKFDPVPTTGNDREYVKKEGELFPLEAEVKGGLTWNITENFIFDFVYTHFMKKSNMFDAGALKIACTVKF